MDELLRCFGIKRGSYYYHRAHLNDPDPDDELREEVLRIFKDSKKRYGVERVWMELNRDREKGQRINLKKVRRLMRELGIHGPIQKPKYKQPEGSECQKVENIVNRGFNATEPLQICGTDVSQFRLLGGGWLYLSVVKDFCTGEILAYTMSTEQKLGLIVSMIMLLGNKFRGLKGMILHSDQGVLYQTSGYRNLLKNMGIVQSMSRAGNPYDNAPTESFFSCLKRNMWYGKRAEYMNLEDLKRTIAEEIEWYNHAIRKKLGGLSPVEFREKGLKLA